MSIGHWLTSIGNINNAQPTMCKPHTLIVSHPNAVPIWTSMCLKVIHDVKLLFKAGDSIPS